MPSPGSSASAAQPFAAPSIRIRVVAHTSPRWRGAKDPDEADRRNLDLSRRRATAVTQAIKARLGRLLGPFAFIGETNDGAGSGGLLVDLSTRAAPGSAMLTSAHRGSVDALFENQAPRASDDPRFRRVDVSVEWTRRRVGEVEVKRAPLMASTLSRRWRLSVDASAGGSLGAAGALLTIRLINAKTNQSMTGEIFAGGGGPRASIGASMSIWSDPTDFSTEDPVVFQDFEGVWVRYSTLSVNAFLGYEVSRFSFSGLGHGAKDIDVGGWNVGTVGAGGATLTGPLRLHKPFPPSQLPIKGSDRLRVRYERNETGGDQCSLHFETQSAHLSQRELFLLDEFLEMTLRVTP